MMKFKHHLFTSALLFTHLLISTIINADTVVTGPIFKDYGPVYNIKDLTVPLKSNFKYKVLFDISKGPDENDSLNRPIESVARFINMHVLHGVKLQDIDIAVVLHGKASRAGLNHEAYEQRYLVNNPNIDLINKLAAKGVKFYQCGQSAYYQQIKTSDLIPEVGMALSALTMLTQLQTDGYQLIPWW